VHDWRRGATQTGTEARRTPNRQTTTGAPTTTGARYTPDARRMRARCTPDQIHSPGLAPRRATHLHLGEEDRYTRRGYTGQIHSTHLHVGEEDAPVLELQVPLHACPEYSPFTTSQHLNGQHTSQMAIYTPEREDAAPCKGAEREGGSTASSGQGAPCLAKAISIGRRGLCLLTWRAAAWRPYKEAHFGPAQGRVGGAADRVDD
jgi:hypothetical protein